MVEVRVVSWDLERSKDYLRLEGQYWRFARVMRMVGVEVKGSRKVRV